MKLICPYCGLDLFDGSNDFNSDWYKLFRVDSSDLYEEDEIECPKCEKTFFVEKYLTLDSHK